VDEVINVAGHRLGTAEIKSALVAHPQVAKAAVVECPLDIKGQGIDVYVSLIAGAGPSEPLRAELRDWVCRGNWSDRCAGRHPMASWTSKNALREYHAPNSSQDRRQPT